MCVVAAVELGARWHERIVKTTHSFEQRSCRMIALGMGWDVFWDTEERGAVKGLKINSL